MDSTCRMHEQHDLRLNHLERSDQEHKQAMREVIKMGVTLEQMKNEISEIKQKVDTGFHKMDDKMDRKFKEVDTRIDTLERMPGQTAVAYWKVVITSLITGGLGFLLAQILK